MTTVRQHMTMRTGVVERLSDQGTKDDYGHPIMAWSQIGNEIPCAAWFSSGDTQSNADRVVPVEGRKVIVPRGTDILEGDKINGINDRRGNSIFSGVMRIELVAPRRDHLELSIQENR